MILPFPRFLLSFLFAVAIGMVAGIHAEETRVWKEIKALLVTGGGGHDFENQKTIITAGISERSRIPIQWAIVHEGGTAEDARIPLYKNENWAKGYDIVIHSECFPKVTDREWVEKILKPHREGVPALLLSGAIQSYPVEGNSWSDFCGAKTEKAGVKHSFEIQLVKENYPVTQPLRDWTTLNDDLVIVKEPSPSARILGQSKSDKEGGLQPSIWVHKYGENKTRVFVTTIGGDNESVAQPEYLDMLASGFLWAIDADIKENLMIAKALEDSVLVPGRNLFTSQSSRSSSKSPDLAIDGDPSTAWKPDRGSIINWWQGSLEEPVKMNSLVVIWESAIKHSYWIEGSVDGRNWEEIVRQAASEKPRKVSFHEFDGTYQYLRISNPETGILGGISEFAAYQSRRDVPSHLISAAYQPGKGISRKAREKPKKRDPVLSPNAAFSLLDSPEESGSWTVALNGLSRTYQPVVVDGLISRITKTTSGNLRHLAIPVLGQLYRTGDGQTWAKSSEIADCLEELFSNRRVDKRQLLEIFLRESIPVKNLSRVIGLLGGNPELRELQLKALERNQVPYGAMRFLTGVVKDDSETPEIRLRAGVLLASSGDMLAMRDAFELVAGAEDSDVEAALKNRLNQSVLKNPTWEAQLDWLVEKSSGREKVERCFAWEVLIAVLEDPESRTTSKEFVLEAMKKSELLAGPSFLSLIAAIGRSENETLRAMVKRAGASESEPVAKAAAAALEELVPKKRRIPLQEMSMGEVRNAVALTNGADVEPGKILYSENCGKCHSGKGLRLTDMSKKDLICALLTPDEEISGGYYTFEFTMSDGNEFSGYIGSETDRLIELIDGAGNSAFLEKDKIKRRKQTSLSTMPSNAADHLTLKEFADLLAYLKTL